MRVIPKINVYEQKNSDLAFVVKPQMSINLGEYKQSVFTVFENRVGRLDISLVKSKEAKADINLLKLNELEVEAYQIEITNESINVYANAIQGVNHALATLYQLLAEARILQGDKIASQIINDSPKFSYRGLLVDVGRHFFDVDEMKKIIEEMSVYKLNVLHWHLTEDMGWRIESKVYPKLHEIGSGGKYYTQEQIRELIQFATERGVEIVPEINIPGHASAAIAAYPELSCYDEKVEVAKGAGIYKVIICAGKENTYQFLFNLLDEIVPLFPSKYIHLGGDEAPKDKWKECPHCTAMMEQNNLSDYEDLQGLFTNKIKDYLASMGKQVICWNDTLKAKNLSDDVVIQYWSEWSTESYTYGHFKAGRNVIFSNVFNLYFDYPHCVIPLKKTYSYEPHMLSHINLKGDNILGIEGAIWTERVPSADILEAMVSVRMQALAEVAWSYNRDFDDFVNRVKAHLTNLGIITFNTLPFEQITVHGQEAEAQAMSFIQEMMGLMSGDDRDSMGLSPEELKGIAYMLITNIFEEKTAQQIIESMDM